MRITAVGNPLYGDDGVGAAVLERIRDGGLFPGAELVDAGVDALSLIDHFDDELNIIIDAARMGCVPGRVVRFTPDEVDVRIRGDHLSLHGFGLAEAFAMADAIGRSPRRVVILGVEPAVVAIDRGLSAPVAAAVPEVLRLIHAEVVDHAADHPGH